MRARIFVVDDEPGVRRSVAIMLQRARATDGADEPYDVAEAASGAEAVARLATEDFDLVIADVRMDDVSGLALLRQVKDTRPETEVIMMTAYGTVESAVEAMKLGAFDFITKPFAPEEMHLRVRNALERRSLKQEVSRLRKAAQGPPERILGVSPAIRRILILLPRLAQSGSTVLITGETGTGKEVVAKAIHAASPRAHGPFVAENFAALPESLLENELFGHAKGAFTGAAGNRKGRLEAAHGGTFFMDEIGDAPLAIQAKLLRVLEARSFRHLGDNRSISVDVRIVAATNRDLAAAVRERTFRQDLFHRLNVISVHLPPLRERREDIPVLARHFLAEQCRDLQRDFNGFSPAAMQALKAYSFPGNIRELRNVIEQAAALATGSVIDLHDLPEQVQSTAHEEPAASPAEPDPRPIPPDVEERRRLLQTLGECGWNISRAAVRLGMSRNTLRYRMEKYGIRSGTLA